MCCVVCALRVSGVVFYVGCDCFCWLRFVVGVVCGVLCVVCVVFRVRCVCCVSGAFRGLCVLVGACIVCSV